MADHDGSDDVRPLVIPVSAAHRRTVWVKRLLLSGPLRIDDELQRLVLDTDRFRCAARLLQMLSGNHRNRLAEVPHTIDRQHGLVGELEAVPLLTRHILVRQDRMHTRHRHRLGDIDRDDPRMRVRAPDRATPQHPRSLQIARVREVPGHLETPRDAPNRVAHTSEAGPPHNGLSHDPPISGRAAASLARVSWRRPTATPSQREWPPPTITPLS